MAGRHNKRDTELTSMLATMLTQSELMHLATFRPRAQQNYSPVGYDSFNVTTTNKITRFPNRKDKGTRSICKQRTCVAQ